MHIFEEMYEFKAGCVCPKKVLGLHLFIVYIAVKYYLFKTEFSGHVHILVMYLLVKVIIMLGFHIKQTSLFVHIKIFNIYIFKN